MASSIGIGDHPASRATQCPGSAGTALSFIPFTARLQSLNLSAQLLVYQALYVLWQTCFMIGIVSSARPSSKAIAVPAKVRQSRLPAPFRTCALSSIRSAQTSRRVSRRARNATEGMALLRAGEVEFVVGAREPLLEDVSVEYREMLCYDIVLITSLDHALAGRETVTPQEAAQWPSVVSPVGSYSRQFGEAAARQFGVEIRAVIEVSGWAVIKRYVERGLGISVVPSICVEETDQVSVIPFEDSFLERSFGVYTLRSRALTGPARRLLELMIPEIVQASGRGIG